MGAACGQRATRVSRAGLLANRPPVHPDPTDAPLRPKLRELAAEYPRWEVPRLHWRLQREGLRVKCQRVERLYRLEGLAVRRRACKRLAVPRVPKAPVLAPKDEWDIDFVSDTLASARRFRCFTVVDMCLAASASALVLPAGLPQITLTPALADDLATHCVREGRSAAEAVAALERAYADALARCLAGEESETILAAHDDVIPLLG